jgi:hypothetical protein
MLNLDETFEINTDYFIQRDLYLKSFLYSIGIIIIINIIRQQVPEINLLQLVPGFYLLLLFLSFLLIVFLSDFLLRFPIELENQKSFGTKTVTKINLAILSNIGFLFIFLILFAAFNSVVPLSLDSFNSYGEKTLENIWSFNEVISLEIILLLILLLLSQFPTIFIGILNTESDNIILPTFWRPISFLIFLFAGFLTPTIDGYTQLGFAIFAISLYLVIISFLQKRINLKFNGSSSLGF